MRVRVKLFAIVRDRAGAAEVWLELTEGATVATAADALGTRVPAIAELLKRAAFAVNQNYAALDAPLHDGDELAVIPPVSGG